MSTQEEKEAAGRAAVQALIDSALDWPDFLVSTMPTDPRDPEIADRVKKLARLAVKLNPLERMNLRESIFVGRVIPKAPVRKIFEDELRRAEDEDKAKAASESAEGASRKRPSAVTDEMRGHVFTKNAMLYRKSTVGAEERISNFSIVPTHRIAKDGEVDDWIRVRVEKPYEGFDAGTEGAPTLTVFDEEFPIPPAAFTSRHAWKKIWPNECASSPGDDEVQGIKEMLVRDYGLSSLPRLKSTSVLGRHAMPDGSARFVLECGTIGPDGQWMKTSDLTYLYGEGVGSTSTLASKMPSRKDARPPLDGPELRATAKAAFADVMRLNRPEDMAAMLGWHFAALVGPAIRLKLAGQPILNVVGSAGAGKSATNGRILWPMFAGVKADGELMSWKGTRFTMAKEFASANALAACWDENREGATVEAQRVHAIFYDTLRGSYTGEIVSRGNADKTMTLYKLSIPSCVSGESRISGDAALVERCVFVVLDGNWLDKHPESKAAYERMTALDLSSVGPFVQAWTMRLDVPAVLAEAKEMVAVALKRLGRHDRLKTRAVANLEWVTVGLVMFNRLAEELGAETPDVEYVRTVNRMVRAMFEEDEGTDLRGVEGRVRSNLDAALEEWSTMAATGILKEGTHYAWVERPEGVRLCLQLPTIMQAWMTARHSQGRPAPPVGVGDLYRKAAEMHEAGGSYVAATGRETRAPFEGGRARCVDVDFSKVPASLGVEPFPRSELKSHGGRRDEQLTTAELLARFGKKTN